MMVLGLVVSGEAANAAKRSDYLTVEGAEALKNQAINQYDDVDHPPQGYIVKLPAGYSLQAVDVVANDRNICGVSAYDSSTESFRIDGFSLETDGIGCEVILTIFDKKSKKGVKVTYEIQQVGT